MVIVKMFDFIRRHKYASMSNGKLRLLGRGVLAVLVLTAGNAVVAMTMSQVHPVSLLYETLEDQTH